MLTHSITFYNPSIAFEGTGTVDSIMQLIPATRTIEVELRSLALNAEYYLYLKTCNFVFRRFAHTAEELTNGG